MGSTNSTKQVNKPQVIEQNDSYREVCLSTEHSSYDPDTVMLFAHIPHSGGDITLTRVSTTKEPREFVISQSELMELVSQSSGYQDWQERRDEAFSEARTLLKEKMQGVLFLNTTNNAEYFSICRYKTFGFEELLPEIHFNQLVAATKSAIELVEKEKVEKNRLINVELDKLKQAGFRLLTNFEDDYFLEHDEFDYQLSIRRDVAEVQESTPKLLKKLEEIREEKAKNEAAKASIDALKAAGFTIDALKTAGFTIQADRMQLRVSHPELSRSTWIRQDLSDAELRTEQALKALEEARNAKATTPTQTNS